MVSSTVQLAQSATSKFEFNAAVDEFIPPASLALNPDAKEFKLSPPAVAAVQTINLDSYSSDDESPRMSDRPSSKGLKAPIVAVKPKVLSRDAKEFIPPTPKPSTPTPSIRPPPGLEKSLGLSVNAKEFVPAPAAPMRYCAINLDDYTDDEEEEPPEKINVTEWRGLCSRLASPYIWSDNKEEFVDEALVSDSEADTAEPSSQESETEGCSGSESP